MIHGPVNSGLLNGGVCQLRGEREERADSQRELMLDVASGVDSEAEVERKSGASIGPVLRILVVLQSVSSDE